MSGTSGNPKSNFADDISLTFFAFFATDWVSNKPILATELTISTADLPPSAATSTVSPATPKDVPNKGFNKLAINSEPCAKYKNTFTPKNVKRIIINTHIFHPILLKKLFPCSKLGITFGITFVVAFFAFII